MPRNTGSEKDFLVTESKHDDYSATLQSSNVRLCSLVDQNMVNTISHYINFVIFCSTIIRKNCQTKFDDFCW